MTNKATIADVRAAVTELEKVWRGNGTIHMTDSLRLDQDSSHDGTIFSLVVVSDVGREAIGGYTDLGLGKQKAWLKLVKLLEDASRTDVTSRRQRISHAQERGVHLLTAERLEYLRSQIEAECISYGEIAELQSLVEYIDEGDTLLLEWAGVPVFEDTETSTDDKWEEMEAEVSSLRNALAEVKGPLDRIIGVLAEGGWEVITVAKVAEILLDANLAHVEDRTFVAGPK